MEDAHVVLFPYLAQGHMIPFLALANLIIQRTRYTVTLVTTPLNILKFKPLLPSNTSIQLAELPFSSSDHGLPPDSENTDTLPSGLHMSLFHASETLQPSFELFLSDLVIHQGRENLCVIADMFMGWTLETAEKLGVFHSVFLTTGASGCAVFFSMIMNRPPIPEHSDEIRLLDYPEVVINRSKLGGAIFSSDGTDQLTTFLRRQFSYCFRSAGLLVNTAIDLEKIGLSLLRRSPGLPLWAVGPLCLPSRQNSMGAAGEIIKWLESKPHASVLYVSFGSQNTLPAARMMELAIGLEASDKPFIWVIRPPSEFEGEIKFRAEWLPEGFEDRITEKQQGLLVHRWAPQREILSHASTGAFLSHCGWNSVIESLSKGVPIIGWPLKGDQLYNCKMMEEEVGVCMEIPWGMSSKFDNEWRAVERTIRSVMDVTEKGKEMRRKAGEIREVLKEALVDDGGSSFKDLDSFFQAFNHKREMTIQSVPPLMPKILSGVTSRGIISPFGAHVGLGMTN